MDEEEVLRVAATSECDLPSPSCLRRGLLSWKTRWGKRQEADAGSPGKRSGGAWQLQPAKYQSSAAAAVHAASDGLRAGANIFCCGKSQGQLALHHGGRRARETGTRVRSLNCKHHKKKKQVVDEYLKKPRRVFKR